MSKWISEIDAKAYVQRYADAVDLEKNGDKWSKEFFSEDATFVIGNFPVSTGYDQIAAAAEQVFGLVDALKHNTDGVMVPEESTWNQYCHLHSSRVYIILTSFIRASIYFTLLPLDAHHIHERGI
jgi:hypothetical protein